MAGMVALVPDDVLPGMGLNTRLHVRPLLSIVNMVSDVPERWSQASVYPDMWMDPDEDPRNSDGASPGR